MRTPQEIRETILELLKEKRISSNKMLLTCGYNTSLVNDMKKGQMPAADKIATIAKYLGVSADYLITGENITYSDSDADFMSELVRALYGTPSHKLNERDKSHLLELAKMIARMKTKE